MILEYIMDIAISHKCIIVVAVGFRHGLLDHILTTLRANRLILYYWLFDVIYITFINVDLNKKTYSCVCNTLIIN